MEPPPAGFSIGSDMKNALIALCDRYLHGRGETALETADLASAIGEVFGCEEQNLSPGAAHARGWIESCFEATREHEPLPPFPPQFVIVTESTKSAATAKKRVGTPAQGADRSNTTELNAGTTRRAGSGKGTGRPRAGYNSARKIVPGTKHYLGDCPTHALDEDGISFMGDEDEPEVDQLLVRAATNFRFVDSKGRHVSVGHGPMGKDPVYLIAACGSLNPEMESGQRLAAGWWNSDPDPDQMKLKAPAEIIWLRIPVQYVGVDAGIKFRNKDSKLVTVDGNEGTYVLQCPDPAYVTRWKITLKNYREVQEFEGVLPEGDCPEWFDPEFWTDLKDEFTRWSQAGMATEPPKPPKLSAAELHLLKRECDVAWQEAILRNSAKGIPWYQDKLAAYPATGRRGRKKAPLSIDEQNDLQEAADLRKTLKEFEKEKKSAQAGLQKFRPSLNDAKRAWGRRPRAKAPAVVIPAPTPTPTPPPSQSPPPTPPPLPLPPRSEARSEESSPVAGPSHLVDPSALSGSGGGGHRAPIFAHQAADPSNNRDVVKPRPLSDVVMAEPSDPNGANPPKATPREIQGLFGTYGR